jgi:hypothetical protein
MPTRIYVLTDGRPQDLGRTRELKRRVAALPVDVDALAFGDDADVALLQDLISGGRGGTVKQVREDTLGEAFERIAEVATRIVSNRAIFRLELAPGVVGAAAYRYRPGRHRFADDAFGDGTAFETDLGAIESGRTYALLFDLRLPETEANRTDVGRVSLRLRGVGRPRRFEAPVSVARSAQSEVTEPDPEVAAASQVVAATTDDDATTQLRALRVRRRLYTAEHRDPRVIEVIERAIAALETEGSLDSLSIPERATLRSHTCSMDVSRRPARRAGIVRD